MSSEQIGWWFDSCSDALVLYARQWLEASSAEMAHTDAYISHRRQGIYGEMFFAAALAAAFQTDDPIEALWIGLTEIPRNRRISMGRYKMVSNRDKNSHIKWYRRLGKNCSKNFKYCILPRRKGQ